MIAFPKLGDFYNIVGWNKMEFVTVGSFVHHRDELRAHAV